MLVGIRNQDCEEMWRAERAANGIYSEPAMIRLWHSRMGTSPACPSLDNDKIDVHDFSYHGHRASVIITVISCTRSFNASTGAAVSSICELGF